MFNIDLNKYRVIDLSQIVTPPGTKKYYFRAEKSFLASKNYKYDIETHTHVGTHIETPAHFFDDGKDPTEFPITSFMGRAILLDVNNSEKYRIIDVTYMDKNLGDIIKKGDIVICRNSDERNKKEEMNFPYLTLEAARWLKAHRIKMLGIDDFFSLGKDTASANQVHDILLGSDINIVERLDNLYQLKTREFYIIALPFKVKLVDSSWTRVIAVEERSRS